MCPRERGVVLLLGSVQRFRKSSCVASFFGSLPRNTNSQHRGKAQNRGRAGFLSIYVGTHSCRCARRCLGSFSEAKKASRTTGSYARGKACPGRVLRQKWGWARRVLMCPFNACPDKSLSLYLSLTRVFLARVSEAQCE